MTLSTLETYALELLGENTSSPDVFTDDSTGMAQIRDSINDAVEEICMLTGCNKSTYFLPLREDTYFYRLAVDIGDLGWITDVWLKSPKRRLEQSDLIRLTHHNPRWLYAAGNPECYFPIGRYYIGVYPAPASDTGILQIEMVTIPERYSESDERIYLPDDYSRAAAHFAVGEYYASRGDAKNALYFHQHYMNILGLQDRASMLDYGTSWAYRLHKEPWSKASE